MKKIKIFATLVALSTLFTSCDLSANNEKLGKGSKVIAGDATTLKILDSLDVPVIAVGSDAHKVDEKYVNESKYPDIGLPMKPNYEKIGLLKPSEFIMSNATDMAFGNIKSNLEAVNANPMLMNYNSVTDFKNSIITLGKYFDKEDKAKEIVKELNKKEQETLSAAQSLKGNPKVLILFAAPLGRDSVQVETEYMYGGSLLKYIGAHNVIQDAYPNEKKGIFKPADSEILLKDEYQPEYIFCIAHGKPKKVWGVYDDLWNNVPFAGFKAVENNKVYYLPSDVVNVICEFNYIDAIKYIVDCFNGKIKPFGPDLERE